MHCLSLDFILPSLAEKLLLSSSCFDMPMNRVVKKVAVLGSGVMGSRIACHLAGAGLEVLLLDQLTPDAQNSTSITARNQLVKIGRAHV